MHNEVANEEQKRKKRQKAQLAERSFMLSIRHGCGLWMMIRTWWSESVSKHYVGPDANFGTRTNFFSFMINTMVKD